MVPPTDGSLPGRLTEHLRAATGAPVAVTEVRPLGGGACQDLFFVAATLADEPRRLVLRSDARASLPGSIDRRSEYAVLQAAVAAGVRTPTARYLGEGLVRPGAAAYFLDFIEGEALGRRVLREPALAQARAALPRQLAAELARIHRITPEAHPELCFRSMDDPVQLGAAGAALAFCRSMLDQMPEPHPALEFAVAWLDAHRPAPLPLCLVHGDFRTGNFLVGPEGLRGLLDWEFCHFGDPMEDLGWLCMRDWRFGQLKKPAGGFASRAALYAAYEEATGTNVDPGRVRYWEIMGNVRWAAGSVFQTERYLSGAESDIELVAIGRRACEMEYEALRLIALAEQGA